MPYKTKAIRTLEQLLESETDPTKKAELATRLSRAQEAAGRERGRRRRAQRARPEPAPQPTVDDSNEPYYMHGSAEADAEAERWETEQRERHAAEAASAAAKQKADEELAAEKKAFIARAKQKALDDANAYHHHREREAETRTLNALEPQTFWDFKTGEWTTSHSTFHPRFGALAVSQHMDPPSADTVELYQQLDANGTLSWQDGGFDNHAANERAAQENQPQQGESFHDHAKRLYGSIGRYE